MPTEAPAPLPDRLVHVVALADGAERRLAHEKIVWCVTVRPDGSPHVTPVWFVFEAGTWWVASARRNVKVANLVSSDQLALALPDAGRPLVGQGRASIRWSDFPPEVVAAFAEKYDGWDITDDAPDGPRVLLEVRNEHWLFGG